MNHKLIQKIILGKPTRDDILELVSAYSQAVADAHSYKLILEENAQDIKILEAENRILKEINADV